VPTLAFYSHVETEVRERAQAAGFDLVVPRSRMAREGADLAARLLAG
jgi:capsular polysaccharide biosynthesis protein